MSNAVDLKQLIDAVRRQPGAPAYALLAERYIESDALAEAIEVCRHGFAANPAYERGAIAYIEALRGTGDAHTAARIYGRAIAEHPRSSRLRMAWAHVLADAGRMAEARLRAREAAELDPMSREARSLLASVGGTPPPALRNTGGIEALGDWPSVVRTPTPEGLPAATQSQAAEPPRPEVPARAAELHPLPGEDPVHALFDFTPGPAMMPSIAPTAEDAPPLDELVDLYEIEAEDAVEDEETAPAADAAQLQAPPAPPPLPDIETPPPHEAPEQTAQQPNQSLLHFPSAGAQPAQQTAPSPHGPLDAEVLPPRQSTHRRLLLWVALPAVALLALAAIGLLTHRILEQSRFEQATAQLRAAMKKVAVDDPRAYRSALQSLTTLAKKRPKDGRVAAARSLVAAHLVLRFGAEDPAPEQFAKLLNDARRLAPQQSWTIVAVAMYRMHGEPDTDPMSLLEGAGKDRDWHFQLAQGTAITRQGRIAEAAAHLEGAVGTAEAPAIVEAAARLARLRGLADRARALVASGLGVAPGHTGLLLQRALLRTELGAPASAVSIAALTHRAPNVPRYHATSLLLQALAAHHEGQREHAISLAETAAVAHPDSSAQAAWLAARWRLPPGGNVGAARAAFSESGPPFEKYRPAAVLWRAQAMLLHGAPHKALKLLEQANLAPPSLQPTESRHLAELLVRASHATGELDRLRVLCPPNMKATREGRRLLATCTAVHLKRGRIATAKRWIKRLGNGRTPLERYLRALLAEAQGDGAEAYQLLKGLIASPPLDHSALLLAQARAYMTRNDLASAIATFRDARRAEGNSTRSRVALAAALVTAAHDTEAIAIIEEVLADSPTDPAALSEAGASLLALGRLADAMVVAKAADSACPRSPVGPLVAGHVALLQSRLKAAHAAFREVLKRDPKNVEALIQLGQIAAKRRRKRLARQRFAAALRQRPKDAHLLYLVAHAHAQNGSYKAAHAYALRAILLFEKGKQPGRAVDVMVKLGRQLATGDRWARERGRELLFRASTSPTPPAIAFLELGRVYKLDKDLARALWCFRKATARDPQLAAAQLEFGRLLYRRGKRRSARAPLKRFLELEPQSPEAARVRALLARKR